MCTKLYNHPENWLSNQHFVTEQSLYSEHYHWRAWSGKLCNMLYLWCTKTSRQIIWRYQKLNRDKSLHVQQSTLHISNWTILFFLIPFFWSFFHIILTIDILQFNFFWSSPGKIKLAPVTFKCDSTNPAISDSQIEFTIAIRKLSVYMMANHIFIDWIAKY